MLNTNEINQLIDIIYSKAVEIEEKDFGVSNALKHSIAELRDLQRSGERSYTQRMTKRLKKRITKLTAQLRLALTLVAIKR